MELVKDPVTQEPGPQEASLLVERMRDYGVLLGTDGPHHNIVKIRPPLAIHDDDADFLVDEIQ